MKRQTCPRDGKGRVVCDDDSQPDCVATVYSFFCCCCCCYFRFVSLEREPGETEGLYCTTASA